MGIHSSHSLGTAWISASREIFKKPLTFECLCFPIFIPYYGNSLSPCFGNCMSSQGKSLQTHILGTTWISAEYFHVMGICTLPDIGDCLLGIAWTSASREMIKKPLTTLECLCFPIFFSYYGNSLFLCFGNCIDFCFTRNI